MNIVLTGMMGTGKSALGKKLAGIMDMNYIDTDELIENKAGSSISDIFKNDGEKRFRQLEKDVVKDVSVLNNYVIATGGGVVKDSQNMDELEKNAIVVCLTADVDTIYERVSKHSHRPLLNVEDRKKEIQNLLIDRDLLYKRCDLMIDTANRKMDEITDEIVKFVEKIRKEKDVD